MMRRLAASQWTLGIAGVVIVVALWQAVLGAGVVSRRSLPSPVATFEAVLALLGSGEFRDELRATLWAWFAAVLLAVVVAVPTGLVVGFFRFWRDAATVPIHVFRSVPPAALIPVAISLFGLGFRMKVYLVAFAVSWLVLLNTIYGVRGVDPMPITVARSLRWNRWQTFVRVIVPSASPSIATGVRVGAAVAFVVVLSAELLGAGSGVGTELLRYGDAQRLDAVYAGIVIVGGVGVILTYGIAALESRVLRWHVERQRR